MRFFTPALFFLISVAYKLGWTAISSLLSDFKQQFGPQILLNLNIAYFFPSIPILIILAYVTDYLDRKWTPTLSLLIRFTAGLGGLALISSYFPAFCHSESMLITATVLVGVCYGLAFGTSYQIVSKFPPVCTVALTAGFVSSGPVVLVLDLYLKKGQALYNEETLAQLFSWVAMIKLVGLGAATFLVITNHSLLRLPAGAPGSHGKFVELPSTSKGGRRHHSGGGASHHSNGRNGTNGDHTINFGHDDLFQDKHAKKHMPLMVLLWHISPAALAIFLSVGTSMMVFPFFTYMTSSGWLGERLPQVLFYVRLVGDVLGRCIPRRIQLKSVAPLLLVAIAKTAMVPLLFTGIFNSEIIGDMGMVGLVGVFWWLSGYLNTCAYLLAPSLVAPVHRSRAASLMTVSFQTACFSALMLGVIIQRATVGGALGISIH